MHESVDAPVFSVVVPSHGRPQKLEACLARLATLHYPADRYEVIVVDDGSPTPVDRVVSLPERPVVKLVRQEQRGPGVARNTGVAAARGHFVAFTDDDCIPDRGWLLALERAHDRWPGAMVGGRVENACTDNVYASVNAELLEFVTEWFRVAGSELSFFTTNNLSVPRDRFLALGGFNESNALAAGEDRIFCHEWQRKEWSVGFTPDAVVAHHHPQSLMSFVRMHHRYGRGAQIFHRINDVGGSVLSQTLTVSFYGRMLGWPFRSGRSIGAARAAALMMLAQAAEATGYLRELLSPRR